MNMYFVFKDGRIVTPALGTILEGITRGSIIELAGKMGHQVEERRFSIDEWREGVDQRRHHRDLRLRHGGRGHPGRRAQWPGGSAPAPASTDLTFRIRQALVDVQFGRAEDTFGWMHRIVVTVRRGAPIRVVKLQHCATTRSTGSPVNPTPWRRSTATTSRRCSASWPAGSPTRTWPRT